MEGIVVVSLQIYILKGRLGSSGVLSKTPAQEYVGERVHSLFFSLDVGLISICEWCKVPIRPYALRYRYLLAPVVLALHQAIRLRQGADTERIV